MPLMLRASLTPTLAYTASRSSLFLPPRPLPAPAPLSLLLRVWGQHIVNVTQHLQHVEPARPAGQQGSLNSRMGGGTGGTGFRVRVGVQAQSVGPHDVCVWGV